ncbi:DUF2760 domain-containing protein, partial [Paraburkholderia sp. Ac-20347]|nr:DUF2760 domain-containing protein [Paraburkholderia sp. Ac-20347]
MTEAKISFAGRLSLAIGSFFAILGGAGLAGGLRRVRGGEGAARGP